jgi:ABC-type oligopeptide transport system substrate-binding subunit
MSNHSSTLQTSTSKDLLTTIKETIYFPFNIEPTLSYSLISPEITSHVAAMEKVVRKCIPPAFFRLSSAQFKIKLIQELPLLVWNEPITAPGCIEISFLSLSSKEDSIEAKLLDILRSWVVPGKLTTPLSTQVLYFHWDLFPNEAFLVFQVKLLIKTSKDLSKALLHLPSLSSHLSSSLKNPSAFKAFFPNRPLLEDMKHAAVHRELIALIEKFPTFFDSSIFLEMGRFFSLCPKSFFTPRISRLITKILACHYLMRVRLLRQLSSYPEKRHLEIRFIRTELKFCFGSKSVLGIVLGIAPLDKHEFFEESHILEAVQSLIPDIQCVQGSFYGHQGIGDPLCMRYIELEKKDGSRFSQNEIRLLKKELEHELRRRIEKLVPAIFMIRNEEETMRNILLLSQELKYLSDLPQVMISLDKQTSSDIFFTVILVRLLKPGMPSLSQSFQKLRDKVSFLPDRLQHVGFLRKNHPKEANVFHLKIPKDSSLLRPDYSVNFYLARQKAALFLTEAIGAFRDYNGGMILKQGELFYQFKDSFPTVAEKHSELLENFFFSLNPIETQATLPLSSLQILFKQFLEARETELQKKEQYFLKVEEKKEHVFAMIRTQDTSFKEELNAALLQYELWSKSLIHTFSQVQGSLYTGLILTHPELKKHQLFIEALHEAIKNWKNRLKNLQILKLSFSHLPSSFDPRLNGDETSSALSKMLFEGLTRLNKQGKPELAIAQSVEISKDRKRYLFKLRKCYWSDGSQVTAYDFEHSWKKILSPQFSTPLCFFFYSIKNAYAVKQGLCSIEQLGVKALNNLALAVDLEYPTPEFLELTALAIYSPVHHVIDKIHPDWGLRDAEDFVCNGPFSLKKMTNHIRYEFIKNPFYWDKEKVRLEQILLSKESSQIAQAMFKNEETDWLGMPMRSWEPFFDEQPDFEMGSTFAAIHWTLFNTEKFPFNSSKLRKAFNLAVDREELTATLPNTCMPACTPLSLLHTMNHNPDSTRGNEKRALELFEEALLELEISRKQFPLITLVFCNNLIREKTAKYLVERWKQLFQIPCRAEKFEYPVFVSKLTKGDFQLATIYWKAWVDHPIYTLNIFKSRNHGINFSKWFDPRYQALLEAAEQEEDHAKQIEHLSKAEQLLMEESPIIPLYYEREKIIKKKYLREVVYSQTTGYVDFKTSYIER